MVPNPPSGPITPVELHRGAVVVSAWAPWCGSCRALAPVIDTVADGAEAHLVRLQVDDDPDLVEALGVRSTPTLIALRDGAEVGRLVGLQSSDAVSSLFDVATGATDRVRPAEPRGLLAGRAAAGATLTIAGVAFASAALLLVGVALAAWAAVGLASWSRT